MIKRLSGAALLTTLAITPYARAIDPVFSHQTAAAGLSMTHSSTGFTNANYAGGGAVADFNNDGFQDVFACSGGGGSAPDKLFINNGDGTFTDQAAAWGLTVAHKGKGCAVGDYNKDGWLDLYVTSAGPAGGGSAAGHHKLYHNNGDGTFTNVATAAGVNSTGTSENAWGPTFTDYDLDGDLDLFVAAFSTGGTRLFRNNGDGTFTNVTATSGTGGGPLLAGISSLSGFMPRFVDVDGDHHPDLYLVADFGTSRYFKSNGDATFTNMTASSGTCLEENGMGGTIGDFNRDGKLDWYVTSIYLPGIGWTGNKIYRNNGDHSYLQYASTAGVHDGGYGWGAVAIDFNHDGWQDIAETNGDGAGSGTFFNEQSYLWVSNGMLNTYTEMAIATGFVQFGAGGYNHGKGRGMVSFDAENDGDQDVLIFSNNEPNFFLRNDLPAQADTHWLRVFLDTSADPGLAPHGINCQITATVGSASLLRSIDGAVSYLSQSELSAHYGLATATSVDLLSVLAPNGRVTGLANVPADQTLTLHIGLIGDMNADGAADLLDVPLFEGCLSGPGGGVGVACPQGDAEPDGDIDLGDFALFQNEFTG